MTEKKPLLVFDFDCTIVDENTDTEVQKLCTQGIPNDIKSTLGDDWAVYMDRVLKYLHSVGIDKNQILKCMETIKYTPGFEELLKFCKENLKAEMIIISDANTVFIEHILNNFKIRSYFDAIYTNYAKWNDNGVLEVKAYHYQTTCNLNGVNLCKGIVLDEYIQGDKSNKYSFVGYFGDGSNDFCPMLRLNPSDIAFARKGYAIEKVINSNSELKLKSEVFYWTNGQEIMDRLKQKCNN